jgi:hypothetical protein
MERRKRGVKETALYPIIISLLGTKKNLERVTTDAAVYLGIDGG